VVVLMPPLAMTRPLLTRMVRTTGDAVDAVLAEGG